MTHPTDAAGGRVPVLPHCDPRSRASLEAWIAAYDDEWLPCNIPVIPILPGAEIVIDPDGYELYIGGQYSGTFPTIEDLTEAYEEHTHPACPACNGDHHIQACPRVEALLFAPAGTNLHSLAACLEASHA